MKHFEINGQVREVGNKAVIKAIRKQGLVPCNLYGLGMENIRYNHTVSTLEGHRAQINTVNYQRERDESLTQKSSL